MKRATFAAIIEVMFIVSMVGCSDGNGSCNPYNEGCGCADCQDHPECQ